VHLFTTEDSATLLQIGIIYMHSVEAYGGSTLRSPLVLPPPSQTTIEGE
jgi:hypothetical protein